LRSFPFDKIKIDKSFLHDSSFNAESVEIIKAVIGLGHSLGMATTVEGVETETQLNLVRAQVKAAARCRGSCSAVRSLPPKSSSCCSALGRGRRERREISPASFLEAKRRSNPEPRMWLWIASLSRRRNVGDG